MDELREQRDRSINTKLCDDCEKFVRLTEDGYCLGCGKHADNMTKNVELMHMDYITLQKNMEINVDLIDVPNKETDVN